METMRINAGTSAEAVREIESLQHDVCDIEDLFGLLADIELGYDKPPNLDELTERMIKVHDSVEIIVPAWSGRIASLRLRSNGDENLCIRRLTSVPINAVLLISY
jgi:hypothetical protein